MRRHSLPIGILVVTCSLLAHAAPARAASPQTWVSATGSDAGACTSSAPCRTFAFALTQTSAGGVISVSSAGDFGPLTIAQSVSIVADGVEAAILTTAGNAGIIVNGTDIVVVLRGLTIDIATGTGIRFLAGRALHVHNGAFRRAGDQIRFAPSSGTSELYVKDTVMVAASSRSISVLPTGSGGANVMIERVQVENNASDGMEFSGFSSTGAIKATVRDSVSAGNGNSGIRAFEDGNGTVKVTIDRTALVNNTLAGVVSQGVGATVRIGDSTVTGNNVGLSSGASGVLASYRTNKVHDNNTDGTATVNITHR